MTTSNIRLTATEVGYLWADFQGVSLQTTMLKYFQTIVGDPEIRELIDTAFKISSADVKTVTSILEKEQYPIPLGFTDEDVNVQSGRLYTDSFLLFILWFLSKTNLSFASVAVNTIAREDVSSYFHERIGEAMELLNRSREVLLAKGIWVRAPFLPIPDHSELIKKKSLLHGWFGEKSTLNGMEIAHLFYNSLTNLIGLGVITGFAQVSKTESIKDYFVKGRAIAKKHVEVLSDVLKAEDLPAPAPSDIGVTTSTSSPFSERLMLYLVTMLNSQSISNYGIATAMSMRTDVVTDFVRLAAEVMKYAEEGSNLLITMNWMEQPPKAPDRDELIQHPENPDI